MEWLILYRNEHKTTAESIRQMLLLHEIKASVLAVDNVCKLEDETLNNKIKNATYCVLLDDQLLVEDKVAF